MNCRLCPTPLKPTQAVYCSVACAQRGVRRVTPRSCPVCDRPLTYRQLRWQQRFCSMACSGLSRRTQQDRDCVTCARRLRRGQLKNPGGTCSTACARRSGGYAVVRTALLDILRASRRTWMTISDISIWLYGDDGVFERSAARQCLYHLRRCGHRFETRRATWEPGHGGALAYRLAAEPSSATRRTAA